MPLMCYVLSFETLTYWIEIENFLGKAIQQKAWLAINMWKIWTWRWRLSSETSTTPPSIFCYPFGHQQCKDIISCLVGRLQDRVADCHPSINNKADISEWRAEWRNQEKLQHLTSTHNFPVRNGPQGHRVNKRVNLGHRLDVPSTLPPLHNPHDLNGTA